MHKILSQSSTVMPLIYLPARKPVCVFPITSILSSVPFSLLAITPDASLSTTDNKDIGLKFLTSFLSLVPFGMQVMIH